jgi:hypothetical protein
MGADRAEFTILALHFFCSELPAKRFAPTAEDWEAAEAVGISVPRVYADLCLGAALAGIAGTLVSVTASITPSIGLDWTLKALIVVVLAGRAASWARFRQDCCSAWSKPQRHVHRREAIVAWGWSFSCWCS